MAWWNIYCNYLGNPCIMLVMWDCVGWPDCTIILTFVHLACLPLLSLHLSGFYEISCNIVYRHNPVTMYTTHGVHICVGHIQARPNKPSLSTCKYTTIVFTIMLLFPACSGSTSTTDCCLRKQPSKECVSCAHTLCTFPYLSTGPC